MKILDEFKISDTNKDNGISRDEYVEMCREDFYDRIGEEMSQVDVELARLRFDLVDTDRNGRIDLAEFLSFECTRRLQRLSPVSFTSTILTHLFYILQ